MSTDTGVLMEQTSVVTGVYLVYDIPIATAIDSAIALPDAGSTNVTITGANFGPINSNPSLFNSTSGPQRDTRVGGTACSATYWTSDSSIVANFPAGIGGMLSVVVTIEGQEGTFEDA
eukprot:3856424-Rhodomonas_salina.1